ncbi:IS4 family transposase [Mycoavidus sp. B2-EB]|uniref:IS4 family transposase n=1 Tax=Mycoavidus sp. B2-EB TaxID=2651972 RepID=UPI0016261F9C|nr:IS4 family transposase [Mycoavidus sp. B2-EB]BBO59763.1 IS4 family transposase [Mycoavidus sp. B2-EB]BBO59855.1 IS4 family transposase [Mycoavidus sp. B2-EB]BBO60263.1 IS4 family transposase [Mycoavidus sp. B2-EB]BBO60303.1 IS4 family transposase [Mycoavidus sp. B2-EB]
MLKRKRGKDSRVGKSEDQKWFEEEIGQNKFRDERLTKRFRLVLERLWSYVGQSIPMAFQDWSNTKAAYRFFSNAKVSEQEILSGHYEATQKRFEASRGPILVLQDTTEFSYKREHPEWIGATREVAGRKDQMGKNIKYTVCGILMHSSLLVTTQGVPLGLAAIKFWTRKKFKGTRALKCKINPTRIPIEEKESYRWLENLRQSTALLSDPQRCVHVGDRESDIYELFCLAQELQTNFLVRTCVDRLATDGKHTISQEMEEVRVNGIHRITVRDSKGKEHRAVLELRYHRIKVLPPIGKQRRYPPLHLTVIHAFERDAPASREPIEWKLITNLSVTSRKQAIEKLDWYALRWKIEVFHKVLKSGCKAEESKLRTAERLVNLISIFCVVSWRIFWMTMLHRAAPDISAEIALTPSEMQRLDQLVKDKPKNVNANPLTRYIIKLAQLGGYLARTGDPPPGNTVIWRGLRKLIDIQIGFELAHNCG